MNPVDTLLIAVNGLKGRKFRFALNLVGILIGCAAITGLISITEGLQDSVTGQLNVFGPSNLIIMPGEMESQFTMTGGTLNWRDLDIISRVDYVKGVTPIIANKIAEYTIEGRYFATDVYGVEREYKELNPNTELAEGRNFVQSDAAVVIVGANIAQPLDLDEPIVELGDRIKITATVDDVEKELTLRVIGILKETGSSFGANLDDSIAIPLKTAQQLYETGNEFSYFLAQADSIEVVDAAADGIEEKMGDRATVVTAASAQEQVESILGTIQSVLGGIAGISLVVAGVGIINTMTVSVMERTKEIGTMKAIGAKSLDVLLMFLTEAMLTGMIGGAVGAGFGYLLAGVIGSFIDLATSSSIMLGFEVVVFAVATSIASGLYPAYRASNMNPVEALRHE
ncbi:MAG: ABC transporter permease [Candidatus Bathyarchaeota archaeon]|nr:ABC transporter permease [Candidatus Bathyarchaeota archaeon]